MRWHPDGATLASCSYDESIVFWHEAGGDTWEASQEISPGGTGHSGTVWRVAFGPDGTMASCSEDASIKVWRRGDDGSKWGHVCTLSGYFSEPVYAVDINREGIIVACSRDNSIKVTCNLDTHLDAASVTASATSSGGVEDVPSGADLDVALLRYPSFRYNSFKYKSFHRAGGRPHVSAFWPSLSLCRGGGLICLSPICGLVHTVCHSRPAPLATSPLARLRATFCRSSDRPT